MSSVVQFLYQPIASLTVPLYQLATAHNPYEAKDVAESWIAAT